MRVVNEEWKISLVGTYGKGIMMCHFSRVLSLVRTPPMKEEGKVLPKISPNKNLEIDT